MNVWEVLQIVLTAFEIGMCFWLCDSLIYNGEFVKNSNNMEPTVYIFLMDNVHCSNF